MEVFPFQNTPKHLEPSYKMDLDIWDCSKREEPLLTLLHSERPKLYTVLAFLSAVKVKAELLKTGLHILE